MSLAAHARWSVVVVLAVLATVLAAAACSDSEGGDTGCPPGAHYDCFGRGLMCSGGRVWQLVRAPVPACPPPSDTHPICTHPEPVATCEGRCSEAAVILSCATNLAIPEAAKASVAASLCAGPAIDGGTASDAGAPSMIGGSCGLVLADVQSLPSPGAVRVLPGRTCDLCLAQLDATETCVHQACTRTCATDADCSDGTICGCIGDPDSSATPWLRTVCIPGQTSERTRVDLPACP